MKHEIETNIIAPRLSENKAKKLQIISDVMNDEVLELFASIAAKAHGDDDKIDNFNQKVLDKRFLIELAF